MTAGLERAIAPIVLIEHEERLGVILTDDHMATSAAVFEERADEGWTGNGYDWTAVARVVVADRPALSSAAITFDPEAGMLAAYGPRPAVLELARALAAAFHAPARLRDLVGRAQLD